MILAKARLIEGPQDHIRVGLTFPTGFEPDEVVKESVRANGTIVPEAVDFKPRRGRIVDIYRELEVSFLPKLLPPGAGTDGAVRITGRFRRGVDFTASFTPAGTP